MTMDQYKLISKLQDKLAAMPLAPLDKRIRNRRDKIAKELLQAAKDANMVDRIDLMAGTR